MRRVRLDHIVVGRRHRNDLGDIDALAASINEVGLLHPLAVCRDLRLVAGQRRLAAVRRLGWRTVPVHIIDGLNDALLALRAEADENVHRLDFAPSEAVAVGRALERLERPQAEARRKAGVNQHTEPGGKLPPGSAGKTRDKVALAVGLSGRTYEKAKAVVQAAAESPGKYRPLLQAMDRTGRVHGVYRRLVTLRQAEVIASEPVPLPRGPFRVVVADPPWEYDKRHGDPSHRGASPYPAMGVDEIKALPVGDLAARDAVCFLWTTNAHLPVAFDVVRAWGFEYKTVLTWVKTKMGLGDWLRGQSEHCLLAVHGRPVVTLTNQTTVLSAPAREHSRKPEAFYRLVESLCPGAKVELFARSRRPGWVAHGDQADCFGRACPA